MTQQKEIISTINGLIETLKDGQEGYKEAADAVKDPQLKTLFGRYSQQRANFANDLQTQVRSLGEAHPEQSSSASGAMHRAWIDIKSAATGGDDHAVLAECERGEDSAVKEYEEALKEPLTTPLRDVVSQQFSEVKAAHDQIRNLRDAADKS